MKDDLGHCLHHITYISMFILATPPTEVELTAAFHLREAGTEVKWLASVTRFIVAEPGFRPRQSGSRVGAQSHYTKPCKAPGVPSMQDPGAPLLLSEKALIAWKRIPRP